MKAMTYLVMALLLVVGLTMPAAAQTLDWETLWWNADQRAARLMQRDQHADAARTFDDTRWRAAALYRAGEYQAAARAWSALDDTQAHYNRGNALARAGDLPAAAEAYETVLARVPDHADARHNLELVRERMQDGDDQQDEPGQEENRQPDEGESDDNDGADGDTEQQRRGDASGRQDRDGRDGRPPEDSGAAGNPPESQAAEDDAGEQSPEPRSGQPEQSPGEPTGQSDAESDGGAAMSARDEAGDPAEQAAMEQWLRRIPDDPGGLLRRKFRYQYQRRERGEDEVREPW